MIATPNKKGDLLVIENLFHLLMSTKNSYQKPKDSAVKTVKFDPSVAFPKMYLLERGWVPHFLWLLILS